MIEVNNQVWSCSQDSTILVWNSEVKCYVSYCVALLLLGYLWYVGLMTVQTQEVLDELEYPHVIQCLLPSRSGQCLYAGTANKSVVVWNTKVIWFLPSICVLANSPRPLQWWGSKPVMMGQCWHLPRVWTITSGVAPRTRQTASGRRWMTAEALHKPLRTNVIGCTFILIVN